MTWETRGLLSIIGAFYCVSLFAGVSATRLPTENFHSAKQRALREAGVSPASNGGWAAAAMNAAVPYDQIDTSKLPIVTDPDKLMADVRDLRFLQTPDRPGFLRRISWLYPYDGCWVRAMLASHRANAAGHGAMAKVFAFGNLQVRSEFSTSGSVSWWYHVTTVFQNSQGEAMVFDPSMSNKEIISLKDWLLMMVPSTAAVNVALCSAGTYGPSDDCAQTTGPNETSSSADLTPYLQMEWENVKNLGKSPADWLGEHPPWE